MAAKLSRVESAETIAWLLQGPDCCGECDRCHAESVELWALPSAIDQEPDAHWSYCAACFRKLVKAATA